RALSAIAIALIIFAGYVFFDIVFNGAMAALGRDTSMTGRTDIWLFAFDFWREKPLLGWGYGGIFSSDPNAPGSIVRSNQWYIAPHFHNNYLQVLAELGAVGMLLYLSMMTYSAGTALRNVSVLH